jgi:eukaryotic-like serine/threonine-protein kinase
MGMGTMIGKLFDDRYRLERKIGSGGMADVYLAVDESLGRQVAIKILSDRYASDAGFVERFRREASAAASLNHPNIVSVYDRGEAEGTYYIAMEFLDGPTLKDEITRRAPLPEAEAIGYATQALDALDFAHRRGVIHRDVKPHNMVMNEDGRLKVTDFGIARAGNAQQMTEVGSIVGTAQYLSPEQARGHSVGPQSDIYSMGIVLYEMLTGELPFTGGSAVEIAMKQVSDTPPPLHEQNRLVSPAMEQVVMRALAKDPALRYPSARAMADELRRVGRGGAASSETVQATRVISAAEAARAESATNVLRPAPPAEPPAGPKRSAWPWVLVVVLLLVAAGIGYFVYQELSGGNSVTVPAAGVRGATCAQAVQRLRSVGLQASKPCRTVKTSSAAENGKVVKTDPAIGSSVDKGSQVTVFVGSVGAVKLPSLAGESQQDAVTKIEGLGLPTPKIQSVDSPLEAAGLVVSTAPAGGQTIPGDKVVTVKVASGFVLVPDVTGQSYADAQHALRRQKLVPSEQQESSTTVPQGQVISTSIVSGTRVNQGTQISVQVSSGPAPQQVPNQVGQNADDARTALQQAGFKVHTEKTVVCDSAQDKIVQSQSPAGGTAPTGSLITIVVGQFKPNDPSCNPPPPST